MKKSRHLIILLILTSLLPGCKKKEGAYFSESSRNGTAEAPVKEVPKDILSVQQAFSNVVKAVNPAVVNISTVSKKRLVQPFFEMSPFFDDFFGGRGPQYRRENSLGSGFLISTDGYIITNDHVVRDAESIQVTLSDEKTYDGKVVGGDPKTDIAVIKISAKEQLPVAVLGDSEKLSVGQWAIAIGNPFGLNRTVTVGVISATGRSNMGIETYENFIQTDASINPGNSGGPLLNVYGEVIGINTAIVAAGQGIGFAIPINMAKLAVPQLIKKGNVTRGWLGISIQPVTEAVAQSFGLKEAQGALVSDIVAGSPAAKAGLKQGDIITRFASKEIRSVQQLQLAVAATAVGSPVELEVLRDGQVRKISVLPVSADNAAAAMPKSSESAATALGLAVEELPGDLRQHGLQGVLVADVAEGGLAADSGLQPGDVIIAVNQQKISGVSDYTKAIKVAEQKGSVAFLVRRGNASIYIAMRIR